MSAEGAREPGGLPQVGGSGKEELRWALRACAPTHTPLDSVFLNDWPTNKLCSNRVNPWEARLRNEEYKNSPKYILN